MRLVALIAVLLALPAAEAVAAPTADLMVVGRAGVLRDAAEVRLAQRSVRVDGGRRCAIGARTPLGVLAGARLRLGIRDYASCGTSARDAGGLYVRQIGRERERGRAGWVYKVGTRNGTTAAGDPAGPFGSGGLRRGVRVLWFWCELGADGCQRTLDVRPARRAVVAGAPVTVTVRGHDDDGRGVPVEGARVRLGSAAAVTGPDGRAVLEMPAGRRRVELRATRTGMVRSFPVELRRR